jgi:NADH-quinone oxidoreductase subunit H
VADFFFRLPVVVQGVVKGLAVILSSSRCGCVLDGRAQGLRVDPGPARPEPDDSVPMVRLDAGCSGILQRLGLSSWLADGGKFLFKEEPLPATSTGSTSCWRRSSR